MGAIKKATFISIAAAALAGLAVKMMPLVFRKKALLKMGKKGVFLYLKWRIARFLERSIFRMGRREPLRGWRRMLWFARG